MAAASPRKKHFLDAVDEVGTYDQAALIAWLSRPEAWASWLGKDSASFQVKRIDTHASAIFLVGRRAYKLKRAVRFPYLDYSDRRRRRDFCRREYRLNRRFSPELYQGVVPITRDQAGGFQIGGKGVELDWLVVMARFDEGALFSELAGRDGLDDGLFLALAARLAALHRKAAPAQAHGGGKAMKHLVDEAVTAFRHHCRYFDPALSAGFEERAATRLAATADLLDRRRARGRVRRCHGDLHLRNICLFEGLPTLFDGIEFDDALACIDVLYDLAFLLMDMEHEGLGAGAAMVLSRYLALSGRRDGVGDEDGLAALPLFLGLRSAIRAYVTADAIENQATAALKKKLAARAAAYHRRAFAYLDPPPPALVAVGGLSGTGKSTLSRCLAPFVGPSPGALVLRTDVIRKRLWGVDPHMPLPPGAYEKNVSRRVYRLLVKRARAALAAGHGVIADGIFGDERDREALAGLARAQGVAFAGLWLVAPPALMTARVTSRAAVAADASDADARVVEAQLASPPPVPLAWHSLSTDSVIGDVRAAALAALAPHLGDGLVERRGA